MFALPSRASQAVLDPNNFSCQKIIITLISLLFQI